LPGEKKGRGEECVLRAKGKKKLLHLLHELKRKEKKSPAGGEGIELVVISEGKRKQSYFCRASKGASYRVGSQRT